MIDLFGQSLFSLLGRVYLYAVYRDKQKVNKILKDKYDDSFSTAGGTLFWLAIAWSMLIAIIIGFIAAFYSLIKELF